MQSIGLNLIYNAIETDKFVEFVTIPESGFYGESELKVYKFVSDYIKQFNRFPTIELLTSKFDIKSPAEPFDYYKEEFTNRYIFNLYQHEMNSINKLVADKKIKEATEKLNEFTGKIISLRAKSSSFITTMQDLAKNVLSTVDEMRYSAGMTGIPTGWRSFDEATSGLQAGDVYVFSGRPKKGKSQIILSMASDAFSKGFSPLLVSMEMTSRQYARRFCGLKAGVNSRLYKSGEISFWGEQLLKKVIDELPKHPFYYVEGQFKRTVTEILAISTELKPHILYIDGAYLVKVTEKYGKTSKWEKITEVAEAIKNLAVVCNIPVVVSFQFNRDVKGTDKSAGFEDIQLADAIGQLASVVIGIFEENEEGTIKRLDIVGGRDGESGYWLIEWDWNTMSFNEINTEGERR